MMNEPILMFMIKGDFGRDRCAGETILLVSPADGILTEWVLLDDHC